MFAFFLTPLGRKILIYAGIAVALFFAYRWWSNSLIERGRFEGRQEQLKEDEKILKKSQEEANEIILQQQEALNAAISTEASLKTELRKVRTDMTSNLDKALAEIRAGKEVNDDAISRIPGDELDAGLRMQLLRLTAPSPAIN